MQHVRVTTSSNIDRVLRRFERASNKLRENVVNEPKTQAQIGQKLARSIAPRDTGTLINAISWKVMDTEKNKGQALIWVRPLANPENGRSAARYAAVHHKIGGRGPMTKLPHQQKASTGDFHWLFIVKDELERRYKKAIRGHIQKFVK
jgi:hypothetical protein